MQRRALIQSFAALAAASSTRLFAAPTAVLPADAPRFLLVFLRGGYDAMSLLVPTERTFYDASRRNIGIPAAEALPLTADWGLHPALKDSVYPLAQLGQAAFIPFAGTDDTSRSHFETQDSIELGQAPTPAGIARDFESGFMNRLAREVGAVDPISFTDQLPLTFRGSVQVGNLSLRSVGKSGIDARSRGLLAQMYRNQPLSPQVEAGFELRDQVAQEMAGESIGEMKSANRNAVSAQGFGLEARRVARLMRQNCALGFIDVGGWDTHVNQGAGTGYLATRLGELGNGLAGFADEIGSEAWQHTVVVVVSEFGRTWRENGNRGTDHGHGSVYWVLGGGLATPAVTGEQVALKDGALFQNRDLPVLNEYRSVLGGLFGRQFGLNQAALQRVFPGSRASSIQLI